MCSYVRNFTGYIYEALNKSDIDTFALIWNEVADKAFAGILGKRQLEIIKEAGSISTFIDKDSQLKHIQSVVCVNLMRNLIRLRLMQRKDEGLYRYRNISRTYTCDCTYMNRR